MIPFDRRERETAGASSEEIEVEQASASIIETRGQLSETLDAIEDRLNPDRIKAQAKEIAAEVTEQAKAAVRDATIGRAESAINEAVRTTRGAGMTMLDTLKQNPIPAAMIGIGLGWLLFNANAQSSNDNNPRGDYQGSLNPEYDREVRTWVPRYGGYSASRYPYYGTEYGSAGRTDAEPSEGNGVTDRLQDTAAQAAGRAQDATGHAVGQVQDAAGRLAGNVQETMGGLQDSTQQFAGSAQDRIQRLMHDSPLVAGGIALAAGMVVGLAVPQTERENELLGDARDSLVDQVKESAREAQERIQDAVGQAGEAAQSALH